MVMAKKGIQTITDGMSGTFSIMHEGVMHDVSWYTINGLMRWTFSQAGVVGRSGIRVMQSGRLPAEFAVWAAREMMINDECVNA